VPHPVNRKIAFHQKSTLLSFNTKMLRPAFVCLKKRRFPFYVVVFASFYRYTERERRLNP